MTNPDRKLVRQFTALVTMASLEGRTGVGDLKGKVFQKLVLHLYF